MGFDAVGVVELGLSGSVDEDVRSAAIDRGRVLITLDGDFSNILRFSPRGTPGVIRLRINPPTEAAIMARLQQVLPVLRSTEIRDSIVVVDAERIRVRLIS